MSTTKRGKRQSAVSGGTYPERIVIPVVRPSLTCGSAAHKQVGNVARLDEVVGRPSKDSAMEARRDEQQGQERQHDAGSDSKD